MGRGFAGKKFIATADGDNQIAYYRVTDAQPQGLSTVITLAISAELCIANISKTGRWWIFFSESNDVKYIYNDEAGDSAEWSSPVTIPELDGFRCVAMEKNKASAFVFLLWKESDEELYISIAETASGGAPGTPCTPVAIGSGDTIPFADLIVDMSGKYLAFFSATDGSVNMLQCDDLDKDAVGTWS